MIEYRGSEWRKWDLHVHTPASFTHQFGADWEVYVDKLIAKAEEHDIAVMGVTDYFSVDGYEKLTNEYEPKGQPRLLLGNGRHLELLPCIELRLGNFTENGNSVNLHVVFDSEIQIDIIRNDFLNKLQFNYRGSNCTLNNETLIRIGSSLLDDTVYDSNLSINDFDEAKKKKCTSLALARITLDFSTIEEKLERIEKNLAGAEIYINRNYLLAIAAKGHGSLEEMPWFIDDSYNSPSRENEIKVDLLNRSSLVFTRADLNIDFMHGKNDKCKIDEFVKKFGAKKACIWGSDAHEHDTLFHPSSGETNDYTWVKADSTFEGLRQIILEPEHRVRIQHNIPQGPIYKLEKVVLDFPNSITVNDGDIRTSFCFDGLQIELPLSPYFNCFVGGRGVGKSTLLNLIDDYYFHHNEKIGELKVYDSSGNIVNVTECIKIDEGDSSAASIDFVSQNNIERLATNLSEFTKYIYGRVKKHGGEDLEPFEDSISKMLDITLKKIDWLTELKSLEVNIAKVGREVGSKEKMVSSITDDFYLTLTGTQKDLILEKNRAQSSKEKLVSLVRGLSDVAKMHSVENELQDGNLFDSKLREVSDKVVELMTPYLNQEEFDRIFKDEIEREAVLISSIANISTEIKKFLEEKGIHPDNIEDLTIANDEISSLKAEREENRAARLRVIKQLVENEAQLNEKDKFEEVLKKSLTAVNEDLSNIRGDSVEIEEIKLVYDFDFEKASIKFVEEVRLAIKEEYDLRQLPDARVIKRNILTTESKLFDEEELFRLLKDGNDSETETGKLLLNYLSIKHNYSILENIYKIHFDDIHKYMLLKVLYGGKPIEATSFGQRCSAALIILLALGNHPIIIDEPEAHLDSSLIANYLIDILKRLKERRQIIFATHNANFVINGDADLIYVMESDYQNSTKFIPTTIENRSMREKLLKLEGGAQAFIKRDKRYSVKS